MSFLKMRICWERLSIFSVALLLILSVAGAFGRDESGTIERPGRPPVVHVGVDREFSSIQAAICDSGDGTLIIVHEGNYGENLLIDRGVSIVAAKNESVTLSPPPITRGTMRGARVLIASPTPTVTEGLTIDDPGRTWDDYAIKVQNGNGHIIRNCVLQNCQQGVWVHSRTDDADLEVENIEISNNQFRNVPGHGVYLQQAGGCAIRDNTFDDCEDGIFVAQESAGNVITKNSLTGCSYGIVLEQNPSNTEITDNDFRKCDYGIYVRDGSHTIVGNRFEDIAVSAVCGSLRSDVSGNTMVNVECGISGEVLASLSLDGNSIGSYGASSVSLTATGGADIAISDNIIEHRGYNASILLQGGGIVTVSGGSIDTRTSGLFVKGAGEAIITGLSVSGDPDSSSNVTRFEEVDKLTITDSSLGGHDSVSLVDRCSDVIFAGNTMIGGGGRGIIMMDTDEIIMHDCSLKGNYTTGITMDHCTGGVLYGMEVAGAAAGFDFRGRDEAHFIHQINTSCTIEGRPVYYHASPRGKTFTHSEAGLIILAGAADCSIVDCDLSGADGILLASSSDCTVLNCNLTDTGMGLRMIKSDGIEITSTVVSGGGIMGSALYASSSSLTATDSSFLDGGPAVSVEGTGSSEMDLRNCTYGPVEVERSGGALIRDYHRLGLKIRFSDNATPVEGADVLVRSGPHIVYSTREYGGDDDRTDADGEIPPVWVQSGEYDHDNLGDDEHEVEVSAYFLGAREWNTTLHQRIERDRLLYLVTSDIRAPPAANITNAEPVENGDSLNISWSLSSTDAGDVSYFKLVECSNDGWEIIIPYIHAENRSVELNGSEFGLVNNETYCFCLISVDEVALESEPGNMVCARHRDHAPPSPPGPLRLLGVDSGNVTLEWTASSSNDTSGYRLYLRGENDGAFGLFGEFGASQLFGTVSGLEFDSNYTFRLCAVDEAGNPSAPTGELLARTILPNGTLSIIVKDARTGLGLAEAHIAVRKGAMVPFDSTMDAWPLLLDLIPGDYEVDLTASGYVSNYTVVHVGPMNISRVEIELLPRSTVGDDDDDNGGGGEMGDDPGSEDDMGKMWKWAFILLAAMFLTILFLVIFVTSIKRHRARRRRETRESTPVPLMLAPFPTQLQLPGPPVPPPGFLPPHPPPPPPGVSGPATGSYTIAPGVPPYLEVLALPPYTGVDDQEAGQYRVIDDGHQPPKVDRQKLEELFDFDGEAPLKGPDGMVIEPKEPVKPPMIIGPEGVRKGPKIVDTGDQTAGTVVAPDIDLEGEPKKASVSLRESAIMDKLKELTEKIERSRDAPLPAASSPPGDAPPPPSATVVEPPRIVPPPAPPPTAPPQGPPVPSPEAKTVDDPTVPTAESQLTGVLRDVGIELTTCPNCHSQYMRALKECPYCK